MGFILNYTDICSLPDLQAIFDNPDPKIQSNYVTIQLSDTGQGYIAKDTLQAKFKLLKLKKRALASLVLKVCPKNLTNQFYS